jgi:hypothetical protein
VNLLKHYFYFTEIHFSRKYVNVSDSYFFLFCLPVGSKYFIAAKKYLQILRNSLSIRVVMVASLDKLVEKTTWL